MISIAGASNVDHNPVMLELESVASSCGQGVDPFISSFHLDGTKLTDPLCGENFSDYVDTHCHPLCKTLSEAFQKKGDKPKRPYITGRTWHLVRFRRWLLKSIKVLTIHEQFHP